jgi:hypothetical protein
MINPCLATLSKKNSILKIFTIRLKEKNETILRIAEKF